VEGGDVPGDVAVDAGEELGDLGQLLVAVVERRDDERDDLEPDAALLQPADGVEDRLQRAAEVAVVRVGEAFQIDL